MDSGKFLAKELLKINTENSGAVIYFEENYKREKLTRKSFSVRKLNAYTLRNRTEAGMKTCTILSRKKREKNQPLRYISQNLTEEKN